MMDMNFFGNFIGLYYVIVIVFDLVDNVVFYINVFGQWFVKKMVNFDDLMIYYFYYGDGDVWFGLIMIFFFWFGVWCGQIGSG